MNVYEIFRSPGPLKTLASLNNDCRPASSPDSRLLVPMTAHMSKQALPCTLEFYSFKAFYKHQVIDLTRDWSGAFDH